MSRPPLRRVLRLPWRRYFGALAPCWDRIATPGDLEALEAALSEVPPAQRALDVGTGTGLKEFSPSALERA